MSANESNPREWGDALMDSVHDYQSEQGITDATMVLSAIEALRTSTLELVEQQRIANLIAYVAICEKRGAADAAYHLLDHSAREGLGLK